MAKNGVIRAEDLRLLLVGTGFTKQTEEQYFQFLSNLRSPCLWPTTGEATDWAEPAAPQEGNWGQGPWWPNKVSKDGPSQWLPAWLGRVVGLSRSQLAAPPCALGVPVQGVQRNPFIGKA